LPFTKRSDSAAADETADASGASYPSRCAKRLPHQLSRQTTAICALRTIAPLAQDVL
jgi:hypothetical protein